MSSSISSSRSRVGPARATRIRDLLVGCGVGPVLELYDVTLFGLASGLVFGPLFFPESSPATGVMLSFMAFGVGFIVRPLGGIIAGHIGDRYGRRGVFQATLYLMGAASLLIGLIPTYGTIGMAAPLILVLCRLMQGIAQGAESGSATLMLLEHAPVKRRGLYTSIIGVSPALGAILAFGAWGLAGLVDEEAFMSWGWRIPFLASLLVIIIGTYVRRQISETPEFEAKSLAARPAGKTARTARTPLWQAVRVDWPRVLGVVIVNAGFSSFWYFIATFSPAYMQNDLGVSANLVFIALIVSNIAQVVSVIGFAALSDFVSRRLIIGIGSAGIIVLAAPFFLMLESRSAGLIITALALAGFVIGIVLGPLPALFSEQFPVAHRLSGFSLGYQIGAILGGGLAPTIATALFVQFSNYIALLVYVAGTAALTIVGLTVLNRRAIDTLAESHSGEAMVREVAGVKAPDHSS